MPYRSAGLLQQWVAEFEAAHAYKSEVRVVPLVDADDIGVVLCELAPGAPIAVIGADLDRRAGWQIHFEANAREVAVSSAEVRIVGKELQTVASLCDFLESKSTQHLTSLG